MDDNQYDTYLQSEEWKETRAQHLCTPEGDHCALCGSRASLEVHHIHYTNYRGDSILGREQSYRDLITLCKNHHRLLHSIQAKYQAEATQLRLDYQHKMEHLLSEAAQQYLNDISNIVALAANEFIGNAKPVESHSHMVKVMCELFDAQAPHKIMPTHIDGVDKTVHTRVSMKLKEIKSKKK